MPTIDVPSTHRALVVTTPGGRGVLAVEALPVPEPGAGQVLVEVAAAGVNFIDVYKREAIYPIPTPFVLGDEFAGTVVAVGPGVTATEVGQVVATTEARGAMATYALAAADRVVPVPDTLAADVACAAMLQGMTAHYLTTSTYPIQAGDRVLVHAAAGGVGQLLVQLAKARGAHVVATVGSAAKVAIAEAAGADVVLRYDEIDDLAAAVREASDGGVHVAYDGVGKATFEASLASLRRRGMLALFGGASGQVPPFDLQRLNAAGSLFVTRPTLAHYVATREELLWRSGEVLGAIADGRLRLEVGGRYPLERAADAYEALEGRATTGKLLLIP
ncbi:quinone oxidoreductase [Jatrophihabitans sp.]|uniref:quinone oxidoreductase family protein n=1 Tax=Jatrophihabitans sp. TaxID=1932789 RepID=UPI0030C700DA|nr:Alcohol dehydrogenase zinc-binding domain protein [Jatrophihabitans sp.]